MIAMEAPRRPVLRYHGAKFKLRDWVISHFPEHKIYTEVYGGSASVLLAKPRSYAEIYNDINGEVVNLFRMLRDKWLAAELERQLRLTPYSREEFDMAYIRDAADSELEVARKLVIRAYQGISTAVTRKSKTGFRAYCRKSGTHPAHDWIGYPEIIRQFTERLQGVVIENRPALDVLVAQDSPETLHYLDPPYVTSTRSDGKSRNYGDFEMSDADHRMLAEFLLNSSSMIVLSGYDSALYTDLYQDWVKLTKDSYADRAQARTECLWLNPAAQKKGTQISMFGAE